MMGNRENIERRTSNDEWIKDKGKRCRGIALQETPGAVKSSE
jgi:hypothetical protein